MIIRFRMPSHIERRLRPKGWCRPSNLAPTPAHRSQTQGRLPPLWPGIRKIRVEDVALEDPGCYFWRKEGSEWIVNVIRVYYQFMVSLQHILEDLFSFGDLVLEFYDLAATLASFVRASVSLASLNRLIQRSSDAIVMR